MNRTEMLFNQIVKDAHQDPNILAFWLDGSRGKGVITPYSDYDCTMLVKDEAFDDYREKYQGFGNRHNSRSRSPLAWIIRQVSS